MAGHFKKSQTEGCTIIFIDQSGISQRPDRAHTWSRHGETPVLQNNFNWDTLSTATGIIYHNFYSRRYKSTVKSAGSWTIFGPYSAAVLDRCWSSETARASTAVRCNSSAGKASVGGWSSSTGYAPELNPAEYIWAYWKEHALPRVCPKDY